MKITNFLKELRASLADEAVSFGVLVIVIVVVSMIVSTIQLQQCSSTGGTVNGSLCQNSTGGDVFTKSGAYNASVQGGIGLAQFQSWFTIIAIVIVAGYLIFMVRSGGMGGGGMSSPNAPTMQAQ